MIQKNDWVQASELVIREMNSLRGKVCSVIEGMHLPEKQERAVVALLKQFTYSSQDVFSQLFSELNNEKRFRYQDNKVEVEDAKSI